MRLYAYYFILLISVSPTPDVTNLSPHKLAYRFLADEGIKFYDISEQLNAMDKRKYVINV